MRRLLYITLLLCLALPVCADDAMFAALVASRRRAVAWTPADLTSLRVWLDAADSGTVWQDEAGTTSATNNGIVGRWVDKSTNSYVFVKNAAGTEPQYQTGKYNSKPAIYFADGKRMDNSGVPLRQGMEVMAVVETAGFTAAVMDGLTVGDAYLFYRRHAGSLGVAVHGGTVLQHNTAFARNTAAIVGGYFDGNSSEVIYNTIAQSGASGTSTRNGMRIGDSRAINAPLDGYIAELIYYAPAADERQKVEGYLAHKWGLEANLPAGHPYKDAAP